MDYLVKSTKWTKQNGYTTWWGPNESGYTDMLYEAGVYSEDEAKRIERTHGADVCIAVPFDTEMVTKAIKQQENIIKDCEKQIDRYKNYINHEQTHIEEAKKKVSSLMERIK